MKTEDFFAGFGQVDLKLSQVYYDANRALYIFSLCRTLRAFVV